MEAPSVKMRIEPNEVLDINDPKFTATKVDPHAPWRLVIENPMAGITHGVNRTSTPYKTLREARAAGGRSAEWHGWTVAWEPEPIGGVARTYRARWVAPVLYRGAEEVDE